MLKLVPRMNSSRYRIRRDGVVIAEADVSSWAPELAEVTIEGVPHTAAVDASTLDEFTLTRDGEVVGRAHTSGALRPTLDVDYAGRRFELKRPSVLRRDFQVRVDGETVGLIRPAAPFLHRAVIALPDDLPTTLQVFLALLVTFMWNRRAAAESG